MAEVKEINRIRGVAGNLPAFNGEGGLADTGSPANAPTVRQLTINGQNSTANLQNNNPFYPQSISVNVANTNGPYDAQEIICQLVPDNYFGPTYWGLSSDGLFEVTFFPVNVPGHAPYANPPWNPSFPLADFTSGGYVSFSDNGTGWGSQQTTGFPGNRVAWTPGGGFTGSITWNDEGGNPQTFDASALGGTGSPTPAPMDEFGNIGGIFTGIMAGRMLSYTFAQLNLFTYGQTIPGGTGPIFVSDGCKPGESTGSGTGVPAYADINGQWCSMCDGTPVSN